jgi:hypothetical protein
MSLLQSCRLSALRPVRAALVLSTLALAGACDDDDDDSGPDVDIESVRLAVTQNGTTQNYTVTANTPASSPVQLRVGTATIVATPLNANGQVADEADEFELRLNGLPAGVTFTRNGTLSSQIVATGAAAGTRVEAVMWHRTESHDDYTAVFTLQVAP